MWYLNNKHLPAIVIILMSISSTTSIFLILSGAVIMAVSIYSGLRSYQFLKSLDSSDALTLHRFNKIHHILTFFFLLGYLAVASAIFNGTDVIGDLFVGLIFFFGAIFVFQGVRLQSAMNTMLQNRYCLAENSAQALREGQKNLSKPITCWKRKSSIENRLNSWHETKRPRYSRFSPASP